MKLENPLQVKHFKARRARLASAARRVLDRPVRFDFRTAESARLDVRHPILGGGVEGISRVCGYFPGYDPALDQVLDHRFAFAGSF